MLNKTYLASLVLFDKTVLDSLFYCMFWTNIFYIDMTYFFTVVDYT